MSPRAPFKALPHVGRASELSLLTDWLSDVASGHGGVQIIAGQSGIGKTRLAKALMERAARDKWTVTLGRVYSVESGVPYAVWSDALVALLRGIDAATRNVLTRGGGWLGAISPAFATETTVEDPDARDGKARLLWNCAQFLARLGARQPLLLVLENLHLADSASLELLHFVARQVGDARVAIVGTYNEAELDRNPGLREMEQSLLALGAARLMRLDALRQDDIEQAVCETFNVDHPPARQLGRRLFAWTRGHPFFVEETLKALVESGKLFEREGHWLGWEVEELDLPRSVRSAASKRLEHLTPAARNVASVAAVIGAHVGFTALRDAAGLPQDEVLSAVDELCKAGILVESDGDGDYDFAHPILQDVVYDGLGVARTRILHAAVARSLERSYGDRALAHADALAFHYSRADASEDAAKAGLYLAAAGRDALSRHADRAAADYLHAALERLPDAPQAERDGLTDDLAQARQRLGDYDGAMALWLRARTEAAHRGDLLRSARVERRMGLVCFWTGRFEEALAHFDAALLAANSGGDEALHAQIQINRGSCWQSLGKPADAERDLAAAIASAERLDDPALLARAHRALLFLHIFVGPPDTARTHGERALAFAQRIGDRTVEWSAHYGLATLAGLTGDGDRVLQHLEHAERLADELQSPVMRVHTDEIAMQYAFASGNWDAGIALAERTIAVARALNQRTLLPRLLVWVTQFYTARGEYDLARRYLDEAWELGVARAARGRPIEVHSQVAVYAGLAAYHLAKGDYGKAVEIGEQGIAIADRAGYIVWATYRLLPVTAEAAFYKRDVVLANALRDRMVRDCERLDHRLGLVWVGAGDGIIARLKNDYTRSAGLLRVAIADLEKIPWVYDAARLRRWLADVLIRLGHQEEGVRELRRSHEVCAALGARVEQERARDMMKALGLRLPARGPDGGSRKAKLTEREAEIARLVIARKANKEIAAELGISARTVTTHVANIFSKVGVSSRAELADRLRDGVGVTADM